MIANENLENLFSISNFQQVMFNIKKLMIIFTSFFKIHSLEEHKNIRSHSFLCKI